MGPAHRGRRHRAAVILSAWHGAGSLTGTSLSWTCILLTRRFATVPAYLVGLRTGMIAVLAEAMGRAGFDGMSLAVVYSWEEDA